MKISIRTKLTLTLLVVLASISAHSKKITEPYKDKSLPIDQRVEDLLGRMTLDEKIMQLNQYILGLNTNGNNFGYTIEEVPSNVGSVINFSENIKERNQLQRKAMNSRLGIPVLFGYDVIHGYRTIFPIPLASSCSWNPALITENYHMSARESRSSGTEWVFAPMLDITHDARWGRVAEGFGEDPYLASVMGVAAIQGLQGNDLSQTDRVASCLKHYVAYGCSEGGRDYSATDVSEQSIWDTYLPPFRAAVGAGARTVMSSFNTINGTPSTANYHYLTEVLKEKFQLPGFIVSDWNAVKQLVAQGYASDRKHAAELAINAGLDMDMIDNVYKENLATLVSENKVSVQTIDNSVRRILRTKFELGLFDNPYTPELPEKSRILKAEYKTLAAALAAESMVLLKNDNNLLPLDKEQKIAVIGPMVKDKHEIQGSWRCFGKDDDTQSLWEGMTEEFGNSLLYAKGCDFEGDDQSLFDEAIRTAQSADVVIMMMGEKACWSGENASRSSLALPQIQEDLIKVISKTGKPIVLVLSAGRPTELCRIEPLCTSILEIWQPGICGGTPTAQILSGKTNPSGKLTITFPLSTTQIPIFYNHRPSARPLEGRYQDNESEPLYPFGYGLSYTSFSYSDIKVPRHSLSRGNRLRLEVDVTNTGKRDGYETVQWYINDPVSRIVRPVKELRHFEKRFIKAGTTQTFVFDLDPEKDLSFTDSQGNKFTDNGVYYIMVGNKKIEINLTD